MACGKRVPCRDYYRYCTVKDLPGSRFRRVIAHLGRYPRFVIVAVTSAMNPYSCCDKTLGEKRMQYGEGNRIVRVFVDIRWLTLRFRANLFSYTLHSLSQCQILMPYFIAAKVAVTAQVKLKLGQRLTTSNWATSLDQLPHTSLHKSAAI